MPLLAERTDRFALLRSISASEQVHERAVYQMLTGHRHSAALINEIPHFGSVLSYIFDGQRSQSDTLPSLMKIGRNGVKNGFLHNKHGGLKLSFDGRIENLDHFYERPSSRFDLLTQMQQAAGQLQDRRGDLIDTQQRSRAMMLDVELGQLLGTETEFDDYSPTAFFLRQCQTAARVINANKGTRVIQLTLDGWDQHVSIYGEGSFDLPSLSRALDDGLAFLIDDLESKPAVTGQGTLLEETLIVAVGEFGRTVALNTGGGRDHYPDILPVLLMGGGVQGGQTIGVSNENGAYITDRGWSQNRSMTMGDLMATIYSALGVDWTWRYQDTPSGRVFEAVDTSIAGPVFAIEDLFSEVPS